jgi:hypothetical protein
MTVSDPIGIAAAAEPSGLATRVAVAGMSFATQLMRLDCCIALMKDLESLAEHFVEAASVDALHVSQVPAGTEVRPVPVQMWEGCAQPW